ncbi:MAG: hypothetical protein KC657_07330 [Myxococcales bacterium]|nr:hypothetical protein [Myxococcales bacterium]
MARGLTRRWLIGACAVGAAATLVGCTSPTLPLPPPTAPTISAGTAPGTVTLASAGGVQPNALVIVLNQNPELARNERVSGTFADETGSWQLEVLARPGDVLDVFQEYESTRSPPVTVQVR